jgi:hypothetical protein
MLKNLLIILFLFGMTTHAQLFDSIGGTLKDSNLGGSLGSTPASPTPTDTSFLSYTPDPAVSEQVLTEFLTTLQNSGQVTPEQAAQMETAFRESLTPANMQLFIDELFVGEGLKLTNLADVLAIYIIASFVVLNDMNNGTTTEQDLAVRNQIASAFASIPDVKNLSDAEKQKTAEALILFTIFLANDWQQAQQGVEGYDLDTVKAYTKDTLLQMGIDPTQFDFTQQGLIRKGAGQATQGTQTGTPTTQTMPPNTQATAPTTLTPELQAQVDAMTPEQLQQMLLQCQQLAANPSAADGIEKGQEVLAVCQAVIAKTAGTTPNTQTTAPTTQTQGNNPLEQTNNQNAINPLGAAADPLAGSYNGQNISLTLSGAGTYKGELTFNGQTYPVQATANGPSLTGTFNSSGTNFDFTATLQGTTLTLLSGGSSFTLEKNP